MKALYEMPCAQADPVPDMTQDTSQEPEQVVTFKDDENQRVLGYGVDFHDSTYDSAEQENSYLGDFLSRPLEIYRTPWLVDTAFASRKIFPWHLFLTNPRIAEKINTFKLLSGTLNIKIMVNGSPFHYGRLFVGMRPTRYTNNTLDKDVGAFIPIINFKVNGSLDAFQAQKTFYSQRPHVFVNPSKNIPQMIEYPFFSSTDWIDVTDPDDYKRLGVLEIWGLNTLQHANDADENVVVSFFAWMSNVKMSGATNLLPTAQADSSYGSNSNGKKKNGGSNNNNQGKSQNNNIKTNSKTKKTKTVDEFTGDGIVSYPASVIESISSKLTTVPFIGKWAKATTIGAGAVKNIASIFGFSNPAILDKISIINQTQFGRMAQTSGDDPIVKLSLDPKNELTIDPSTVGLCGDDEMTFMSIAKREALLFTTTWATGQSGHLAGWRVTPTLGFKSQIETDPDVPSYHWLAPVGQVAKCFDYWSGSLVFRIQVICSQFHRGRIALVYTPDVDAPMSTSEFNATEHYTYIIDIMQETDLSFEIKWAQPLSWANTRTLPADQVDVVFGSDVDLAGVSNNPNDNGRLDMYVLTDLGSPVEPNQIDINVYMSAGQTFKVGSPNAVISEHSFASFGGGTFDLPDAQSSGAYNEQENEDKPNASDTAVVLNGSTVYDNTELFNVYMGEDIRSVRALLKRYTPHNVYVKMFAAAAPGDHAYITITSPNFPIGRSLGRYGSSGGDQYSGVEIAGGNVWMTYFRWFGQAFIAYRGGVRYKYIVTCAELDGVDMAVLRNTVNFNRDITVLSDVVPAADNSELSHGKAMGSIGDFLSPGFDMGGVQVSPNRNTNTVSIELPWYHPTRFGDIHAEPTLLVDGDAYNGNYQRHNFRLDTPIGISTVGLNVKSFVAGAEDSSFFFFIGMPPYFVLRPSAFV